MLNTPTFTNGRDTGSGMFNGVLVYPTHPVILKLKTGTIRDSCTDQAHDTMTPMKAKSRH